MEFFGKNSAWCLATECEISEGTLYEILTFEDLDSLGFASRNVLLAPGRGSSGASMFHQEMETADLVGHSEEGD